MRLTSAAVALLANAIPSTFAAEECVVGSFELEFEGSCTPEAVLEAYSDQVFHATGGTLDTCELSAEDSFASKLAAAGLSTAQDLCDQVYKTQPKEAFTDAANRGTDITEFEQMFFNGCTDWQEEVATDYYDNEPSARTAILKEDAEAVRTFYESVAQGRRVAWPGELPNFKSSVADADEMATCATNAAMCCWPKDRQANDNNGNCAKPYDLNCVDKDPADNTNLCFVDVERGNASTGSSVESGFLGYPEDNGNGEGAIHCHGLAWSNDVNHHTARYKANNLFFVSMYDHMYQRGYVKNIPGAPMCGCVEQMPTVSRSDCTQVDLTETIKITFDGAAFDSRLTHVHVDFNACQGINNRNNDLWAYIARLYYDGDISPAQFGQAGRIITNTGCREATRYHLNTIALTRGYDHDIDSWTKVAGRDDMFDGHQYGREAFKTVLFEHSLTKPDSVEVAQFDLEANPSQTPIILRICPDCTETHKKIYYRRLTPVPDNFDILHNILYHRSSGGQAGNIWNTDFTLHSTYEDAETGANPWLCPNNSFNNYAPFYGECSPTGARVRDQYSIWNWFPGPQGDVAYYVNAPEGSGIEEVDLATSDRLSSYTSVDLGDPAIAGRVFEREEDDAIIISAGGHDIWGHRDYGHFFSEPWSGDVDVSVHVSAFTGIVDVHAKAGIMLRADNGAEAAHVFGMLSGARGSTLGYRRSQGGGSYHDGWKQDDPIQKSEWIRLVKKMDKVEFYLKNAAGAWYLLRSVQIRFPEDSYRVGLAVTSHNDDYASEAIFEDYNVEEFNFPTSSPSVSAAPTSWDPTVAIGGAREGSYWLVNDVSYHKAYGEGIWGSSDSFFFRNWQRGSADAFDVVAYVNRFHTGYPNAKGGIMIRDSDDPDAAHAFLGMSGYYTGLTFISRAEAGASTDHHQTIFVYQHLAWVRLSKPAGSGVITAYYKVEAEDDWIEMGSTGISYTGPSVRAGVAATPGDKNSWAYVELQTKGFEIVDGGISARKLLRAQ